MLCCLKRQQGEAFLMRGFNYGSICALGKNKSRHKCARGESCGILEKVTLHHALGLGAAGAPGFAHTLGHGSSCPGSPTCRVIQLAFFFLESHFAVLPG